MLRIGFTIILNGMHHLRRNRWAQCLVGMLDLWVIAEGASLSKGSTRWCKDMPEKYYDANGHSVDGTWEYIQALERMFDNVVVANNRLSSGPYKDVDVRFWRSKDAQVNACIDVINSQLIHHKKNPPLFLWQLDADEEWSLDSIEDAERALIQEGGDTGMFLCNYRVGENLEARGEWGEGLKLPYRRLWKWNGNGFLTHEPPVLYGGNGGEIFLPQRFTHHAYVDEQDVAFKDKWYSGHEGILERWKMLQEEEQDKPIGTTWPISRLLPPDSYWGKTETKIVKVR